MTRKIGRTRNFNDEAVVTSSIVLSSTTSTTISSTNEHRIFFFVQNNSNINLFIKLQEASLDDDKKGIKLSAGDAWEMPTDNIYRGEISGIAEVDSPEVLVTEY